MFGWFKKRVVQRMRTLLSVSQIAVGVALLKHYGLQDALGEADRNARAARAAAAANYLFGKSPDPDHVQQFNPDHVQQFNLPEILAQAREWLQDNAPFRELVVQSRRVATAINAEASGAVSLVAEDLLSMLGGEFPDAPDPAKYEALIEQAIASLPPSYQQSIRARMGA